MKRKICVVENTIIARIIWRQGSADRGFVINRPTQGNTKKKIIEGESSCHKKYFLVAKTDNVCLSVCLCLFVCQSFFVNPFF